MRRADWLKENVGQAVAVSKDTGIFPATVLAAAVLESSGKVNGYYEPGQSLLAKNANNYFGIKAGPGWSGPVINLQTGEYLNGQYVTVTGTFRKYSSPAASFADYINFLKVNPRYKAAGVFSATSPHEQAQALQRAGYATDPQYANKLISLINEAAPYLKNIAPIVAGGAGFFLLLLGGYYLIKKLL